MNAIESTAETQTVAPRVQQKPRWATTLRTTSRETALPKRVLPVALPDLGTGSPVVRATETQHLEAHDYLRALAVLPIDPEIDARVEALAKAHEPTKGGKRPLQRKR
jgi:hypothetical protein